MSNDGIIMMKIISLNDRKSDIVFKPHHYLFVQSIPELWEKHTKDNNFLRTCRYSHSHRQYWHISTFFFNIG